MLIESSSPLKGFWMKPVPDSSGPLRIVRSRL